MRKSPLAASLVLATLCLGQPAPVVAQPRAAVTDVRSQLPDAARRAWDAAKQLADARDFKGALVELKNAYELSQNPRVLYNIGALEKLLTHYARAVDAWERELREGAGRLTPAEMAEARSAIGIVQQFVTTIDVTANEPGATLWIDDYTVGQTPFAAPVKIDVGKHVLKLTKEGFADAVQQIEVASGQRTPVSFTLEPKNKTALVSVTVSGAPSATVFVDGKDMGPAPFKGELPAERHTIEARAPGFVTVGQTVDVQYRQPMSLVLSLSQERHEGRLKVNAPEGAEIALDEKKMGATSWEGIVSTTGGHHLVVTKPGYQTWAADVSVADDQTRELNVQLNSAVNTNWVAWGIGSLLVVTGGVVAGIYVFQPSSPPPFAGTLGTTGTSAAHGVHLSGRAR